MTKAANNQEAYSQIAKTLHWMSAVIIIGLFALGLWMVDLGYYDPWYKKAPDLHKSIGISFFLFMIGRILWRRKKGIPKPLATHKNWEQHIAHITHIVLYGLIFAIMVAGYLISTADGRPISVFGLLDVPAVGPFIDNQEDIAGDVHFWLAWSVIGLAALHAIAALKHHFIDKDDTLRRMTVLKTLESE